MRVGLGVDSHAFAPGRDLVIGGVVIPHEAGLAGHSDADVLCHAIGDALLGAAGLGDLGAMFPASDEWRGASSLSLLEHIAAAVAEAGRRVVNVDSTVIAQAPRLSPHTLEMATNVASALGVEPRIVSVKATTTDGLGFAGRGEGVAAMAVALVEPVV
ncbi:MAG: 2-C-methyl-D-erythritol 2,4-cyclodiphosphate synthase [Actinomycetota bacterium]|nr:2-C-methyl-D-erythritol 2,4-cyclodiphosphate synthase [Actinomycetota bacterium]